MTSSADLNHFNHSLGFINIDGIVYKASVRYFDEDGQPIELTEEFEKQTCMISGSVKKQLDHYVSSITQDHINKLGKNLKDTRLIVLKADGISFDDVETKGHDFDASENTRSTLKEHLKEDVATISKIWEKTHDILIQDFEEHISSASKSKLSFTGEFNSQKTPRYAEMILENSRYPEPSAPPLTPTSLDDKTSFDDENPLNGSSPSKPQEKKPFFETTKPNPSDEKVDKTDLSEEANQARPLEETEKTQKTVQEILGEMSADKLAKISPYLPYFHPLNWKNLLLAFQGLDNRAEQAFLGQCEQVKQEVDAHRQRPSSDILLATDDQLLNELSPEERTGIKPYFDLIENTDTQKFLGQHETSLTDEELRSRKQKAKADLLFKYKKQREEAIKTAQSIAQEEHPEQTKERLTNYYNQAKPSNMDEPLPLNQEPEKPKEEQSQDEPSYLSYFSPTSWYNWFTEKKEEKPQEVAQEPELSPPTALEVPLIYVYDQAEQKFSPSDFENREKLLPTDKDVISRIQALKSYSQNPQNIEQITVGFLEALQTSSQEDRTFSLKKCIQRYQLHIGLLQSEYIYFVGEENFYKNKQLKEKYIQFKARLDTAFKSFVFECLDQEFKNKPNSLLDKKGKLTKESEEYIDKVFKRYLEVAHWLKKLGPSFHQTTEDIIAKNRSNSMLTITDKNSAQKYITSLLDEQLKSKQDKETLTKKLIALRTPTAT